MSELPIDRVTWHESNVGIRAEGQIPRTTEFFQDHFPEFPILPGVLAIEILKETALRYYEKEGFRVEEWRMCEIQNARFKSYLKPMDTWESHLVVEHAERARFHWKAQLNSHQKPAVVAHLIFTKE